MLKIHGPYHKGKHYTPIVIAAQYLPKDKNTSEFQSGKEAFGCFSQRGQWRFVTTVTVWPKDSGLLRWGVCLWHLWKPVCRRSTVVTLSQGYLWLDPSSGSWMLTEFVRMHVCFYKTKVWEVSRPTLWTPLHWLHLLFYCKLSLGLWKCVYLEAQHRVRRESHPPPPRRLFLPPTCYLSQEHEGRGVPASVLAVPPHSHLTPPQSLQNAFSFLVSWMGSWISVWWQLLLN